MPHHNKTKDVSSAEITAIYRSSLPHISGDFLSAQLIQEPGRTRAAAFIEKYNYPLVQRKIALSSSFCRQQANRLLATGLYDSVISFASGFSLLTYYIKKDNPKLTNIVYYDTDLENMASERMNRLHLLRDSVDMDALNSIQIKPFNIEKAYSDGKSLKESFPECRNPIFICDGVVYFLTEGCTRWLIDQAGDYQHSALVLYYWHTQMHAQSQLFSKVFNDLNQGMILETLTHLWDQEMLDHIKKHFSVIQDWTLADYERSLHETKGIAIELTDMKTYFPIQLLCCEK